jgi:hypothetical protein
MRITLEQREAFRRAYNEAMSRKDMAKADEIAAVWGKAEEAERESVNDNPRWLEKRQEILARDGGKCVACGSSDRVQVDHKIPVSLGGAEFENENLQVLCRGCHIAKTRKEFLLRRTNYGY